LTEDTIVRVPEKPEYNASKLCLGHLTESDYEWQKVSARSKQPNCIRPRDSGLFALAGLWERWHDPQGQLVETCTILTTEVNELMRPLHDRMPVILDPSAEAIWLDPRSSADVLRSLFVPFASERIEAFPVSPWVSDPKHEGARCLESMIA
jgi:putative SOS response-associated peptidase YedK